MTSHVDVFEWRDLASQKQRITVADQGSNYQRSEVPYLASALAVSARLPTLAHAGCNTAVGVSAKWEVAAVSAPLLPNLPMPWPQVYLVNDVPLFTGLRTPRPPLLRTLVAQRVLPRRQQSHLMRQLDTDRASRNLYMVSNR